MERLITGVMWYNMGNDTIGIVRTVKDNEVRYWIGTGGGHNEEADEESIANVGAKFPKEAGDALFNTN